MPFTMPTTQQRRVARLNRHLKCRQSAATAHRQTKYAAPEPIQNPARATMPAPTLDIEQAKRDLTEKGMCILTNAMSPELLQRLRVQFDKQAEDEARVGARVAGTTGKSIMGQLCNKGRVFMEILDHEVTDVLAGYLLGRNFLLSSLTGHMFNGQAPEPQMLHRDQGFVPATADFPAVCNCFWLLDDFTAENGGTQVVPASHRWPAEHQIKPPSRDWALTLEAPAGSVFAWDGRVWHGTGANTDGSQRRTIGANWCLPWMRQQENWGVTLLQEVLEEANEKVQARLGLLSYGTLGTFAGGAPAGLLQEERGDSSSMNGLFRAPKDPRSKLGQLGNGMVEIPGAVVGERGALHPMRRVSRVETL